MTKEIQPDIDDVTTATAPPSPKPACGGDCTQCSRGRKAAKQKPASDADGASNDMPKTLKAFKKGIREDMGERLPGWMQDALTKITGKPLPTQLDVAPASPVRELKRDLLIWAGATTATAGLAAAFGWWATPLVTPFMLVQVGRLRKLQVAQAHEASHRTFLWPETRKQLGRERAKRLNDLVLELATTIAFVQNGAEYRRDHNAHHNQKVFCTASDPDAAFLLSLGFKPGMSERQLWLRLGMVLVSPSFHGPSAWSRLKSNLVTARGGRLAAGWAWATVLLGSAALLPFEAWFLAVFLPWFPLYQIAALLQFCCRHAWLKTEEPAADRAEYADRCWARFCGARLPDRRLTGWSRLKAWFGWGARMLFVELPIRTAVLPSVLMAHDLHHLHHWCGIRLDDHVNTIFLRERVILAGGDPYRLADREIWGLFDAIRHTFQIMSKAKPFA